MTRSPTLEQLHAEIHGAVRAAAQLGSPRAVTDRSLYLAGFQIGVALALLDPDCARGLADEWVGSLPPDFRGKAHGATTAVVDRIREAGR